LALTDAPDIALNVVVSATPTPTPLPLLFGFVILSSSCCENRNDDPVASSNAAAAASGSLLARYPNRSDWEPGENRADSSTGGLT
jgi:hypothetical protein